tara:strand:+ start:61 stop:564 length:504 start_codon:yes stop_codon:yes gene_type:complete
MIKVLENPITSNYLELKELVLSSEFPWLYSYSTKMPFYSHVFLDRPENAKFSNPQSKFLNLNLKVLDEIIRHNNLFDRYFFLRSNANCVHADSGEQFSEPHIDHRFPHFNLLVYLTNEGDGGETFVEDEKFHPQANNIILFKGKHHMKRPNVGRRVILISTIFEYNS